MGHICRMPPSTAVRYGALAPENRFPRRGGDLRERPVLGGAFRSPEGLLRLTLLLSVIRKAGGVHQRDLSPRNQRDLLPHCKVGAPQANGLRPSGPVSFSWMLVENIRAYCALRLFRGLISLLKIAFTTPPRCSFVGFTPQTHHFKPSAPATFLPFPKRLDFELRCSDPGTRQGPLGAPTPERSEASPPGQALNRTAVKMRTLLTAPDNAPA